MYRTLRVIMFALLLATAATSQATALDGDKAVSVTPALFADLGFEIRSTHYRAHRYHYRRTLPYRSRYRGHAYRPYRPYSGAGGRRYRTVWYWDGVRYRSYRRYY
ncbi:MAG: hypothetical protein AAGA61_05935 [Pseudomonadota bacterium]